MIDLARISVRSDVCFCNFFVCISNNRIRRDVCTERSLAHSKSADLTLVLLDGSSRGRLRGGSILNLLKACASMYRDYLDSFDACYSSWPLDSGPYVGVSPSSVAGDETLSRSPWSRSNGRSFYRCTTLSDREAAAARVPPLWPDVLVGIEPAETPEDGLRHGHLRDALLLPVLSL